MVRRILVNVRREFCFKVTLLKRLSGFRTSKVQIGLSNETEKRMIEILLLILPVEKTTPLPSVAACTPTTLG